MEVKPNRARRYRYTVSRIDKNGNLYGPLHTSEDGNETLCGQPLNENWAVTHNSFDGRPTCRKCIALQVKGRQ